VTYWLEDERPRLPDVRHDGRVDVAIVGGGVTGCACARVLAEAARSVRLYDAREIAGGASGRNGGFALRGGAMPYDRAREWLGPERAREYWRLTEGYVDRLESLAGDAFRRVGSLRIAADEEELEELRGEYEALREDGFEAEWRDALPPPLEGRFAAAIFHPPDGAVQPARFVRRLAVRAAEAGVEIREHQRVGSLDELDAETVVIATDGYPSGLLGELEGSIIPTRGQMIATEPLPERIFDRPHYGRHGFDYWQQTPDGRMLAGGFRDFQLDSEFTADEVTTPPIQDALESFVADLLGRRPEITHRWAGIFGLVLDFMPVVGEAPGLPGTWVAGGYSGHGNVLGLACGELVAHAVLGERNPLLDLFDPQRLLDPTAAA
jgi:glycine/D-amino acid oxidase-like deaminating enzyme